MAVKWETVQAGDVLYDVRGYRMGYTTMRAQGCWEAKIVSIDHLANHAVVRWNGNPAETWHRRQVVKLRRSRPKAKASR